MNKYVVRIVLKIRKNLVLAIFACLFITAMNGRAGVTFTNALWSFPTNTASTPSQPINVDFSTYSVSNRLTWTEASSKLSEAFVLHPGDTTALEFSYNGNKPDYLNASTLTLTTTISGLAEGDWLEGIQLSCETQWNKTGPLTETWAYSLNGGAFINFAINDVSGGTWQTFSSSLTGLQLWNGDTITFRSTFTGATGVNGSLDFDNIQITSQIASDPSVRAVPEPSAWVLMALGAGLAGHGVAMRNRRRNGC